MQKMIISKSETADTRTCDYSKVSKEKLLQSSKQHIYDVSLGMNMIAHDIIDAGHIHDHTKLTGINQFHKDFKTGFESTIWWENHQVEERHHLAQHVPEDVDLVDVIEFMVDGIMAGMARSGEYRKEELPEGLLQKAFDNTVKKFLEHIEVQD